jgi:uncharacterized phage protein (TIGR01671 family)
MNRILKFRAWDKAKKEWITDWQDTIYPEIYGFDGGNLFDVMQFTGLHDKNGKEIYEGDVVEINDGNDTYIREVKWEKGGYTFDIWEDFAPLISDEALTLEVIGNRFEHPDLLEKSE